LLAQRSPVRPVTSPLPPLYRPQKTNKQLASTTEKLQEEKLRLDALLVRQYNLIEVLGKPHKRGCRSPDDGAGTPDGSTGDGGLEGGLTLGKRS
jgi:hypothetical protein